MNHSSDTKIVGTRENSTLGPNSDRTDYRVSRTSTAWLACKHCLWATHKQTNGPTAAASNFFRGSSRRLSFKKIGSRVTSCVSHGMLARHVLVQLSPGGSELALNYFVLDLCLAFPVTLLVTGHLDALATVMTATCCRHLSTV